MLSSVLHLSIKRKETSFDVSFWYAIRGYGLASLPA